jgi:hypothetical protein
MPPKKAVVDTAAVAESADTNTKKRKNATASDSSKGQTLMTEREYMLYAALRIMHTQTGTSVRITG